jgi:hypothetical protein
VLEPDDGKPSSPVLRGLGASNGARPLNYYLKAAQSAPATARAPLQFPLRPVEPSRRNRQALDGRRPC